MADKAKKTDNKSLRKPSKGKTKKPSKYDEKFVINGTFEELVKELVTPNIPINKK